MIKIEKRGFGYKTSFGGMLKIAEIQNFINELIDHINSSNENFSIYFDFRGINYFAKDAQMEFNSFRTFLKKRGMVRSTIILSKKGDESKTELIKLPLDSSERILYSYTDYNFEIEGINWLTREIDPNIKIYARKKGVSNNLKSEC